LCAKKQAREKAQHGVIKGGARIEKAIEEKAMGSLTGNTV